MVTFTCHNCGDSVKKPKVDKHINNECKKRKYGRAKLCCIDCLNDFDAESYVKHTSCISEAERYSAPGFVAKQSSNKGERKQNSWINVLNSVSNRSDLTGAQRQLLNAINQFENVPRKKSKFQNFIRSSVRHIRVNPQTVDQLYDLLEQAFKSTSDQNTNNAKKADLTISNSDTNGPSENSNTEGSEPQNEKKKRKLESSHDASISDNGGGNELTNVPNGTNKKKKKRKHDGDSENQKNEADAVEPQSAFNSANDDFSNVLLECDERTQKKKKKRERVDEVENSNDDRTNTAVDSVNIEDNDSSIVNNDHSEKKRKKKKKREKSDLNEVPSGGDSLPDTCNVENQCSTEKKKKKSSHKTNGDLSEMSEQTIESTEQPVKIKSKKLKIADVDEATTKITANGSTVEESESETQANKEDKELKKKNKKKKKQNGDSVALEPNKSDGDMAVDNSIVGEDEEKAETEIICEPTKKSKKRKREEASTELISQSEDLQMDGLSENGTSKKKKKKKSKTE